MRTGTEAPARAHHWTWWFGLALGGLLLVAGVAETVRAASTGAGGLGFWFATLVGGGTFVVAGTLLLPRSPTLGGLMTMLGALVGILPTIWTLVVPVLLVVLIIVSARHAAAELSGP